MKMEKMKMIWSDVFFNSVIGLFVFLIVMRLLKGRKDR